jgi:hypothetical protein
LDGYGNGGGIFVTTSVYDDGWKQPGWGAATLYGEHGYLECTSTSVAITGNTARRWGAGLYVGISPAFYTAGTTTGNYDPALAALKGATVRGNTASQPAAVAPLYPSQIAAERVGSIIPPYNDLLFGAVLDFGGTSVSGNATTDVGIYLLQAASPAMTGTTFSSLASETVNE